MESMVKSNLDFWAGKRVLITGHTGFKGSWLMIWLRKLGAEIYGFSLEPDQNSRLFKYIFQSSYLTDKKVNHHVGDIRDKTELSKFVKESNPDVVFHLAAQPLVKKGYEDPLLTWETNLIGSLNLLDELKNINKSCAVIIVTTDKVYKNNNWIYGYRELDALGGYDPYSASKAALEIAVSSWRDSFCINKEKISSNLKITTARAGNVIGGGDWADDRIVPDTIRSIINKDSLLLRNPYSTRPWQHVLEPLWGYILLAKFLYDDSSTFSEPFNFGPNISSNRQVKDVVEKIFDYWPGKYTIQKEQNTYHEAVRLNLNVDKAFQKLNWFPKMDFDITIQKTVKWYKDSSEGKCQIECCLDDINFYQNLI